MPIKDPEKRRKYHNEYIRNRLATDPEYKKSHMARVRNNDAKRVKLLKEQISIFRKDGCLLCPEKEVCCLSAHHLESEHKDFSIGEAVRKKISVAKLLSELEKCVCLCENCHRKVHAGVIKLGSTAE